MRPLAQCNATIAKASTQKNQDSKGVHSTRLTAKSADAPMLQKYMLLNSTTQPAGQPAGQCCTKK